LSLLVSAFSVIVTAASHYSLSSREWVILGAAAVVVVVAMKIIGSMAGPNSGHSALQSARLTA
jgi:hypothetical protein